VATQILLVDDSDLLADDPVDSLTTVGYTTVGYTTVGYAVQWTLDAQCALGRLVTSPLHWAILDVRLPGMDDITLCREMRKRCALLILLRTSADSDEVRWFAGPTVALQVPVTGIESVHAIAHLLEETMGCLRQLLTTIVHPRER
jgi:CheY-like chemotaxis protein